VLVPAPDEAAPDFTNHRARVTNEVFGKGPMSNTFARQSFLGVDSEALLSEIRVGVIGLGGGGSHIVQQLAHVGVGRFAIFDPDLMDFPNLNRTVCATFADCVAKTPKVIVAEQMIRGINPHAEVWPIQSEWQKDFPALRACDVAFGCIDDFSGRAQLEESCRRAMVPLIDIGMDVHKCDPYSISGQVVLSMPGRPCFRCVGFIKQTDLDDEGRRYGEAGGNPQVVWPNGVLASTAVGLFVRILLPWCDIRPGSTFLGYDGDAFTVEHDRRLSVAGEKACEHFGAISDLGDPFWKP
jgi:molybdopterin-synthase adenylyltransferase